MFDLSSSTLEIDIELLNLSSGFLYLFINIAIEDLFPIFYPILIIFSLIFDFVGGSYFNDI